MVILDGSMPKISVIVPFYNEEGAILKLYKAVKQVIASDDEMVFVNDGSKDNTRSILDEIAKDDISVKVIHLARNYGQTAAMTAAIDYALGDIIIAMDGDFQNDPNDIPRLIEKINEGYDVLMLHGMGWIFVYSLVHIEIRYIATSVVMFLLLGFAPSIGFVKKSTNF